MIEQLTSRLGLYMSLAWLASPFLNTLSLAVKCSKQSYFSLVFRGSKDLGVPLEWIKMYIFSFINFVNFMFKTSSISIIIVIIVLGEHAPRERAVAITHS